MTQNTTKRLNFPFIIIHTLVILTVITNLLTGFRMAILDYDGLQFISPILPQGLVHPLHIGSAILLSATAFSFVLYRGLIKKTKRSFSRFHQWVVYYGYFILLLMIITGWLNFYSFFSVGLTHQLHFYGACLIVAYLLLHGWLYFIQYGARVFSYILLPQLTFTKQHLLTLTGMLIFILTSVFWMTHESTQKLMAKKIELIQFIEIDGLATESIWKTAPEISINTFGGANFINGATTVNIKALHNTEEIFFHITWQDPSYSVEHLPLIKGEKRWHVQGDNFYQFNEEQFYEDKFALMLSNQCGLGASGTAHLGPQPLPNKPKSFHGKGYHYSTDKQVHDIWQWKAVRTNEMYLADDNFFGHPKEALAAERRYTAGYQADAKESGAYVMNWDWYNPKGVVPKRLPLLPEQLTPYQSHHQQTIQKSWVSPWFEFQPYQASLDNYAIGTIMPSVLYNSNKMEGDRADVRAYGQWKNNMWHLEMVRKKTTGSTFDLAITSGICLWVAAFDHAQIAHTRHNFPLKLELGK